MSDGIRDLESKPAMSGGPSREDVDGSEGIGGRQGARHAERWAQLSARSTSRRVALGAILSVGLAAAACGSSPTSAVSNTASTGSAAAGVPATIIGSTTTPTLGRILVDLAGATLYRFTADQNGQSSCTGSCAQLWPPFTVTAGSQPKAASGVVGVFATSKRADGTTQVTYNGSPLYTFSGDKAAGSTAGQGVLGKWFVVNVSATPAAAPTATTAPADGSTTTPTGAPSTAAITPTTVSQQPATTTPAPTSPPPTAPPTTAPPTTSPPTTEPPPPPTTTPTTMGYGY